MKKLEDYNENDEDFSLIDLYPKYVINSKGILKDFDIAYVARSINRETGLELETCEVIAQEVLRKIIGQGLKRVSTNYIREIVCLELTARGLEKFRNIYARYINISMTKFSVDEDFIEKFKEIQPKWGSLGYITYKRTYARYIEKENRKEEFWETLKRVVEGCFSIQKEHCVKLGLPWNQDKAQKSAQIMFQKMWNFKFIAPGRGLWIMGTSFIDRHGSMALNNCGFASTEDIDIKGTIPFEWTMDALMLGVGVGFDTKGAGKIIIKKPKEDNFLFRIPDSREGWVEALKYTLEAYFFGKPIPKLDYSLIRPAGELIRGFGGIASGPEPLEKMIENIKDLLNQCIGDKLRSTDIVDIMNFIGKCVVAGNVRRSAEIALGDINDTEFITMKQDKEKLTSHRWASNNSIFAKIGMDYSFVAEQIAKNGEPGVLWLENSRAYSRMAEPPDYKDKKVAGVNPCITGDTLIAVADGRNAVSIKQLAEKGLDVPVYCRDNNGRIVIRIMRNPRITRINEEIYEVKLDDGSQIKCTGDHKFILKDMSEKEAKDLRKGDSLMIMAKWQTSWDEMMGSERKEKKTIYWMINDGRKNIFEHTFIFESYYNKKVPKNHVIHHKDNIGTNNDIKNLEMMSKEEHDLLHDISGDKNPMRRWWSKASEEEKRRYRESMSRAVSGEKNPRYSGYSDDVIYNEMVNLIKRNGAPLSSGIWRKHAKKIGMPFTSPRWGHTQTPTNLMKRANIECGYEYQKDPVSRREYNRFIKLLKSSDLKLSFEKGIIYVEKKCEGCGNSFKIKYSNREQAYCSRLCLLRSIHDKGQEALKKKYKKIRKKKQELIFKLLIKEISLKKKIPSKPDFLKILRENGIADFRSAGMPDSYAYILDQITENFKTIKVDSKKLSRDEGYAKLVASRWIENGVNYNHKIVSVKKIGIGNVFNGTVDEFHNFGIVLDEKKTKSERIKLEIIFTANCGEQSLESYELCCLVESFPSNHESYEEFQDTLKYAYLYAKSVTLLNTHWKQTNAIMGKNRRIGTSQSGIINAFIKHGRREIFKWCEKGYKYLKELDSKYSDWLTTPKSIKMTSIKPSGSVSLLPGVTPGIHYPHSEYYIRRIRFNENSDLLPFLREAGYEIHTDKYSPNTSVVEFPIHEAYFERAKKDVSMWEQLENAAAYQKYWADNQVSITVTFKEKEAKEIKVALEIFEDKLKGVTFLPLNEHGYEQAPYEEITQEQYHEMKSKLKPLNLSTVKSEALGERFCDADFCEIKFK